jgi:hypothetical protein
MTDEKDLLERRRALQKIALGALTLIPAASLACGKRLDCTDVAGLTPDEQEARRANVYVDKSPDPSKRCDNCGQYVAAAPDQCGGCKVLKGPVHPQGYCKLWVTK